MAITASAVSRILNKGYSPSRYFVRQRGDHVLVQAVSWPLLERAVRVMTEKNYSAHREGRDVIVTGKRS